MLDIFQNSVLGIVCESWNMYIILYIIFHFYFWLVFNFVEWIIELACDTSLKIVLLFFEKFFVTYCLKIVNSEFQKFANMNVL